MQLWFQCPGVGLEGETECNYRMSTLKLQIIALVEITLFDELCHSNTTYVVHMIIHGFWHWIIYIHKWCDLLGARWIYLKGSYVIYSSWLHRNISVLYSWIVECTRLVPDRIGSWTIVIPLKMKSPQLKHVGLFHIELPSSTQTFLRKISKMLSYIWGFGYFCHRLSSRNSQAKISKNTSLG